ncbi:MAG: galactose mutarotase [Butyrivibrio sp.]|nr:galactose mutarotase [Butyrivibrio sp.]
MSVETANFGKTKDGREIKLYTVANSGNTVLKLTDMGAVWVSMLVRDKNGVTEDVVLGLESGEEYEQRSYDAFGATVGRNANRIYRHKFALNGSEYDLADNDSGNNLHSGPNTYYTRLWESRAVRTDEGEGAEFSLFSPDGDQGMPGNLKLSVTYILTEDDSVIIEYRALSDADTVFNMTNHSYFNLGGHKSGSIDGHTVQIYADKFTFGTNGRIADDELYAVKGTPLDFGAPKRIGDGLRSEQEVIRTKGGYDHNFCLENNGRLMPAARVAEPKSGRVMEISTDMPGLQMYTGNYISPKNKGKDGAVYAPYGGVAFETQCYPDAVNHPSFPSPIIRAGEEKVSRTVYHFDTAKESRA